MESLKSGAMSEEIWWSVIDVRSRYESHLEVFQGLSLRPENLGSMAKEAMKHSKPLTLIRRRDC